MFVNDELLWVSYLYPSPKSCRHQARLDKKQTDVERKLRMRVLAMAKKVTASRKGRKCKFRGCNRKLNIYNHDVFCHVHIVSAPPEGHKSIKGQKGHKTVSPKTVEE
jgi:hypothetical protein